MTRYALDVVSYAPLYIHSFRLVQPHTLVEAEKFNLIYTDPAQIDKIADKLRWYRYQHGLLQRDVADYAGLDRSTYSGYENTLRDYYPIEKMEKIAELFAVPVTDLLDEFNLFLYNGQGTADQRNAPAPSDDSGGICQAAGRPAWYAASMGAGESTDLQADMAQTENQRITQRDGVMPHPFADVFV